MENKHIENSIEDQLLTEGICSKGFGMLPKLVMRDKTLNAKAKLIYACLVSHTGNCSGAFPGRSILLKELGINKETYYIYFSQLIEGGFIRKQQIKTEKGTFSHNVYTILRKPGIRVEDQEAFGRNGIYSAGWGIMPNMVFRDERLSWKNKLLYAYLCVFMDHNTNECSPTPEMICNDLCVGRKWAVGAYDGLITAGYIVKKQQITNGRFAGNIFILNQNPQPVPQPQKPYTVKALEITEKIPQSQNPYTDRTKENKGSLPQSRNPYTVKPNTEKPYTENPDINNTIINNTNINITSQSFIPDRVNDVIRDIEKNIQIPSYVIGNMELAEQAISYLSDFQYLSDAESVKDEKDRMEKQVYIAAVEAIINLLAAEGKVKYMGTQIDSKWFWKRLNRNLDLTSSGRVSICRLLEHIRDMFVEACKKTKPVYMAPFMRTVVLNAVTEGNLTEYGAVIRDFPEYYVKQRSLIFSF